MILVQMQPDMKVISVRLLSGVNDTLDAVIGPLNVAAEYVERISRGDIPKQSRTITTVISTRSRTT